MPATCTVHGCDRTFYARDCCQRHYYRLITYGNALGGRALHGDVADAYWRKVDKRRPEECWPWLGAHTDYPRGQLRINGRTRVACRVGWKLEHGEPPPADKGVLHTCDNAMCHNPAHWFLGTQTENLADMRSKGRGGAPPRGTTTEQDVAILDLLASGTSQRQVAAQLGVGRWIVSQVALGRR